MDKVLLKRTAFQSVALMLAVITISFALRQYQTVRISASDADKGQTYDDPVTEQNAGDLDEAAIKTGMTNEPAEVEEEAVVPPMFPDAVRDVDRDIIAGLGDRYLVIKKPAGETPTYRLEDLYVTKSIRFTLSGLKADQINDGFIGRVCGDKMFIGSPQFTEITSFQQDEEGNSQTIVKKEYGNDPVHQVTISSRKEDTTGVITSEILLELDDVYVHILYEDEAYYYIDLKRPKEVYDRILVIDAGHGGKDAGALSKDELTYEKNINLKFLLSLKELLDRENIKVYYTRLADETIFLRPRVTLANTVDCDFFISIHCNANESVKPNGTEILYYDTEFKSVRAKELADIFSEELALATPIENKGLVQLQGDDIFILENAVVPAVIIEVGYMTNQKDLGYFKKEESGDAVANGIYKGVLRAYEELQPMDKNEQTLPGE